MTITAYAFPVLYDVSFPGFERPPKTDQHGIYVIEVENDGKAVQGFLLNRNFYLRGYAPQILDPDDYCANSWAMYNSFSPKAGLEYNEGSVSIQIKPLLLNSPIGKVIRHDYHDIPLKTTKEF